MKRKSPSVSTLAAYCLLLLVLSGCQLTTLGSTVGYQVSHDVPFDSDLCVGGLKGKLSSGELVMFESPVVPLGERYDVDKERGKIDKGDSVLAEAWCYGTEDEELGYIAAEGILVPSYGVGVAYYEPHDTSYCLTGKTNGDIIPCIISSIIEQ